MLDDKALIALVQKYPLLYDMSSPLYSDQSKKDEAWNEIANYMSSTAQNCKGKWTRLRDNYRKALILRKKAPFADKTRAVKYEKELSFLKEKFSERRKINPELENHLYTIRNKEIDDKKKPNNKRAYGTRSASATEGTSTSAATNTVVNDKAPADDLYKFFESIAETVKKFPKMMQVNLKRHIFNTVNEMEASLLEGENSTADKPTHFTLPTPASMPTSSPMPLSHIAHIPVSHAISNAVWNAGGLKTSNASNLGYVMSSVPTNIQNENASQDDTNEIKIEQSYDDIKIEESDNNMYSITINEEILP